MTYKLFALFFTLALSACGTVLAPAGSGRSTPASGMADRITLPRQIRVQGKDYTLKHQSSNAAWAEYYLAGEQGYQWSRLITVIHAPGVGLDDLRHALEKQHKAEKLPLSRTQTVGNRVLMRFMYHPIPGDARFASYETDLAVIKHESCGSIGIQYAERHPASSNATKLAAALAQKQKAFAREAETILKQLRCK